MLDSGSTHTTAIPVHDGYVLQQGNYNFYLSNKNGMILYNIVDMVMLKSNCAQLIQHII